MNEIIEFPAELRDRIDTLAARSHRSPTAIMREALEDGHSIEWQERFFESVQAGIKDANANRFAGSDEIARLLEKHRPD